MTTHQLGRLLLAQPNQRVVVGLIGGANFNIQHLEADDDIGGLIEPVTIIRAGEHIEKERPI